MRVLILGDGNFSFSLALARMLYQKPGGDPLRQFEIPTTGSHAAADFFLLPPDTEQSEVHLVCTSFDTGAEVVEKYPEFVGIRARLQTFPNVAVMHEINAWQLELQFPEQTFDAIVWNHPHLGVEDFRLHRFLMAHFFHSAHQRLAPGGFVSASVITGQETRWDLVAQAARTGLQLVSQVPFLVDEFPGYIRKRNKNGQSFTNSKTKVHVSNNNVANNDMRSNIFRFAVPEQLTTGMTQRLGAQAAAAAGGQRAEGASGGSAAAAAVPDADGQGGQGRSGAGAGSAPSGSGAQAKSAFACVLCSKSFSSERGLKTHVRQVHELKKYGAEWKPNQSKKLACEECGRK